MTKFPALFAALQAPFYPEEVQERTEGGRTYQYVRSTPLATRLDDVVGPENWSETYKISDTEVLCSLTITTSDGRQVTKCGASGYREGMPGGAKGFNKVKAALSDSFKLAAERFGLARYLRNEGVPFFALDGQGIPYEAPGWLTNLRDAESSVPARRPAEKRGSLTETFPAADDSIPLAPTQIPASGPELSAWAVAQGKLTGIDLVRYIREWGKLQGFPASGWTPEQIRAGHEEGLVRLAAAHEAADRLRRGGSGV